MKLVALQQALVPQVPVQNRPGQGIVRQILPGQLCRRGVQLDTHPGQLFFPLGRQQEQRPYTAPQVTHGPLGPQGAKARQQHAVPPQLEAGVGLGELILPQIFYRSHAFPSCCSICRSCCKSQRTMRPVIPQMKWP